MIPILYDDKHIVVCQKPVGFISQMEQSDSSMVCQLSAMYPHNTIYTVHRLDREVGGVMVYAKTKQAARGLSADISNRAFTKEYYAVVDGILSPEQGTYKDLLFWDSHRNKSFVIGPMGEGVRLRRSVKEASLDYQLVKSTDRFSLVKVHLHTGRTHQIRVQFASRQMPLLGDRRYGSKYKDCSIALWSYYLKFTHPITKKEMAFTCPVPKDYPWSLFSE